MCHATIIIIIIIIIWQLRLHKIVRTETNNKFRERKTGPPPTMQSVLRQFIWKERILQRTVRTNSDVLSLLLLFFVFLALSFSPSLRLFAGARTLPFFWILIMRVDLISHFEEQLQLSGNHKAVCVCVIDLLLMMMMITMVVKFFL